MAKIVLHEVVSFSLPEDRCIIVASNPLADLRGGESSYIIDSSPSL
jgi:hypothetical protein